MTVPASPRQLLSAQLGIVVPHDDAPALLAADGPRFRRLAWTGQRMLRVQGVRALAGEATAPEDLERALEERVGRTALERGTAATGVMELLPGGADAAQVAAACVAAGHRTQGWSGALAVAVRLVDLSLGRPRLPRGLPPEVALAAGRAAHDAAAALLLTTRHPDDDVPALQARPLPAATEEELAQVGRVLVVKGEQAAVETALPLLRR